MPRRRIIGIRGYRAGLYLCPPRFRREFGSEMVADASACMREVAHASSAARWSCGWHLLVDLIQTAATQWWLTGLPVIACVSILPMWLTMALFAQVTRTLPGLPNTLEIHDAPLLTFELIVCTALLIIVSTIAITLVFARPRQLRRRIRR